MGELSDAHKAIESTKYFHPEADGEDDDVDTPLNLSLNGWVMLGEWIDIDTGETWFTMRSGDATADRQLPLWRRIGFYETAKHSEFRRGR